jgi:hypothetical protein
MFFPYQPLNAGGQMKGVISATPNRNERGRQNYLLARSGKGTAQSTFFASLLNFFESRVETFFDNPTSLWKRRATLPTVAVGASFFELETVITGFSLCGCMSALDRRFFV